MTSQHCYVLNTYMLKWTCVTLWSDLPPHTSCLFLLSSSCLQGARLAGRDAGRPDGTNTRKLRGVFIVQKTRTRLDWTWPKLDCGGLESTAQDWTDSVRPFTKLDWTIVVEATLLLTGLGIETGPSRTISNGDDAGTERTAGENRVLHWKKKTKKRSHCGSGCYWISVDDFPRSGEDDVVMTLECVCVCVCVCVLNPLSCEACDFPALALILWLHCHRFSIFISEKVSDLQRRWKWWQGTLNKAGGL